jgi:cellulose synthase/poly-beta-1,6-N-acetylglucosamine synthase-like glycosyltransferase
VTEDSRDGFSVVIPMYNAERRIARAIQCVLDQTYPAQEIIVVDDGSADAGANLVALTFPGVTLISQSNQGAGPARNRGVEHASTAWVAFLDADDLWSPHHLAVLARIRQRHPDAGLIGSGYVQTDEAQLPVSLRGRRPARTRSIDYFKVAARNIGVICSSTAAVQRAAHQSSGGFSDDRLGQDLAGWARIALNHQVAISSTRTAVYVRGTGGAMERAAAARAMTSTPASANETSSQDSPSMRIVRQALRDGTYSVSIRSLERYLDGRITAGWKRVILHQAQPQARQRLPELHHPLHWTALRFRISAFLPPVACRFLVFVTRLRRGRSALGGQGGKR